jgi:replicative DNA helicase
MTPRQESDMRLPPQNLEAERSVLGSMLRDNGCIADVLQILRGLDFYTDAHQKVFEAIVALWDARNPAVPVSLAEELKCRGHLKDIGNLPYLAQLWDAPPTSANVIYYARIVRDKAIIRGVIHACNDILRDAYDQAAVPSELLQAAERRILAIAEMGVPGTAVLLDDVVGRTRRRIDARVENQQGGGLSTGFIDLDRYTGGLQPGELILVGARPSIGKTSFALALAHNLAVEKETPVFFASLEQLAEELAERLGCIVAEVDSSSLRRGKPTRHEPEVFGEALSLLETRQVWIDDCSAQTVLRIAANARRLKARHGFRAVFIDYLGLIEPEDRRVNRAEQIGAITRRLKGLAKELQLPVVALAQLNRELESRKDDRPKLSDLRDSGSQEQDADTVILLHRPSTFSATLDLIVAKQRNGPTGDLTLRFKRECYRFENDAPDLPR